MQRSYGGNENGTDDGNINVPAYPSSLWPLILNRVINEISIATNKLFHEDERSETLWGKIPQHRVSVAYSLMIGGVAMDL